MSDEDRLIHDHDISWYNIHGLLDNMGAFNFYITTDFATSEKTSGDYSVISVWAYNHNGDWFWVDGVCKKQLMDKNIDDLFRLVQIYNPQQVGVEVSGQQGGFVTWINTEMMKRSIFFSMASDKNGNQAGIRPTTNKLERFNIVVPWFKLKRMFFPIEKKLDPEMVEAMDELSLASSSGFKSKHDDFIDTISMLGCLTPWKPSKTIQHTYSKELDVWEYDEDDRVSSLDSYIV